MYVLSITIKDLANRNDYSLTPVMAYGVKSPFALSPMDCWT